MPPRDQLDRASALVRSKVSCITRYSTVKAQQQPQQQQQQQQHPPVYLQSRNSCGLNHCSIDS
ncbi:uncharacterized protein GLRG_07322 [Colletotrichum graminicola M1.001]|uniref:Uncharacterized protein n=1 Tax=Colletotrichum graminicola (strain M1.001 / M2 / FGSC 10212) TaxID=645133 RepID=E3QMU0_COLGM|nr:uncharacterized protein GLRG_07322 [Colletotrichum graminicola M1.001]EFQ32178.1 hypothetical protein GLRG_07322 [Colletotrichum graminicola M1.001]